MMNRFLVLLSLVALSGQASAAVPQDVVVRRSADDRSLTVRYTGGRAALVELRINGEGVATRAVNHQVTSGEVEFPLEPARFKDGANTVEVRLLDSSGKVIATERTEITVDRQPTGPVYIARPASGAMVQGAVEISVGFKSPIPGAFVSFFVDNEFQALKNFAPYTFLWDTTRVDNGWHEVEAWVVDRANNTFRTQRLRVLVNNPTGRTVRRDTLTEPTVSANPVSPTVSGSATTAPPTASGQSAGPALVALAVLSSNSVNPVSSGPAGAKRVSSATTVATGERIMAPTGKRTASVRAPAVQPSKRPSDPPEPEKPAVSEPMAKRGAVVPPVSAAKSEAAHRSKVRTAVTAAPATPPAAPKALAVTYGARLPVSGAYEIRYMGEPVKFDVAPCIIDGLPLAPFRHLFERAGGEVLWSGPQRSVRARGQNREIKLTVGSDTALVNGERVSLERSVFLQSGRAIVPLSFLQSVLDVDVVFDPSTRHAVVTKKAGS